MERKDWLYLGMLLTIILLFAVVICNQIVLEKRIENSLDEKIQQITDHINETAFKSELHREQYEFGTTSILAGIAGRAGISSEVCKAWIDSGFDLADRSIPDMCSYYGVKA